jgi:hypothetical protein
MQRRLQPNCESAEKKEIARKKKAAEIRQTPRNFCPPWQANFACRGRLFPIPYSLFPAFLT